MFDPEGELFVRGLELNGVTAVGLFGDSAFEKLTPQLPVLFLELVPENLDGDIRRQRANAVFADYARVRWLKQFAKGCSPLFVSQGFGNPIEHDERALAEVVTPLQGFTVQPLERQVLEPAQDLTELHGNRERPTVSIEHRAGWDMN